MQKYIKGNVRGYPYRGRSLEALLFTYLHDSNAVISGKFLAIWYSDELHYLKKP